MLQYLCAGGRRCPCCVDIIDQYDRSILYGVQMCGVDGKGTSDDFASLPGTQRAEWLGLAVPNERIEKHIMAVLRAEDFCNLRGLIKATFPNAPAMERHRHKNSVWKFPNYGAHALGEDSGQTKSSAIFEFQNNVSRDLSISYNPAHAVVDWRL
jgi:hypothetical protein